MLLAMVVVNVMTTTMIAMVRMILMLRIMNGEMITMIWISADVGGWGWVLVAEVQAACIRDGGGYAELSGDG